MVLHLWMCVNNRNMNTCNRLSTQEFNKRPVHTIQCAHTLVGIREKFICVHIFISLAHIYIYIAFYVSYVRTHIPIGAYICFTGDYFTLFRCGPSLLISWLTEVWVLALKCTHLGTRVRLLRPYFLLFFVFVFLCSH